MSIWLAILLIIVGAALVITFAAGRLVEGVVGTSYSFGVFVSQTEALGMFQ